MELYLSQSNWYLSDTEHPPLPIPEVIFFHETYIQHVSRSDHN